MEQLSTKEVLDNFGERVTKLARINIGAKRKVNGKFRRINYTGKLRKSLQHESKVSANSIAFSISMEDYGEEVENGQKAGKSPSVATLKTWIRKKPIRIRVNNKFVKMTDKRVTRLAKNIKAKIHLNGKKPNSFLKEPFENEFKKLPEELIEGFGLDAERFLQTSINNK